jgi:hypothetical protein
MHLGRTGIGETDVHAAIDQRLDQRLCSVQRLAPVFANW